MLRFEGVHHSLLDRNRRGDIAFSDDTSISVLTQDKKNATHRGRMWLNGKGKDAVYNAVHRSGKVMPVYRWAHARRKFLTALESGDETARRSLTLIGRMFRVERYLKGQHISSYERKRIRRRVSGKIIAALEAHWRLVGLSVAPMRVRNARQLFIRLLGPVSRLGSTLRNTLLMPWKNW